MAEADYKGDDRKMRRLAGIGIVILAVMLGGVFFSTGNSKGREAKITFQKQENPIKEGKDPGEILKENTPGELEQFHIKRNVQKANIEKEEQIPSSYARFI